MRSEYAVKVVKMLRRWSVDGRGKTKWQASGYYTHQSLIPQCTAAQKREAERIMASKRLEAIRWVDVSRMRSFQRVLNHKSLLWNTRNIDRMQRTFNSKDIQIKGINLPIVVWAHGVPIVWNGNHRVTAAMLHGRARILTRCNKKMGR